MTIPIAVPSAEILTKFAIFQSAVGRPVNDCPTGINEFSVYAICDVEVGAVSTNAPSARAFVPTVKLLSTGGGSKNVCDTGLL